MNNTSAHDYDSFKRRLGSPDVEQIRLLLNVSPAQRLRQMLDLQAMMLKQWQTRLRRSHPDLDDLALCRLLFERLKQNG